MRQAQDHYVDESGDRKYFSMIPHTIVNHSTVYEQSLYLVMKRIAGEKSTCWASSSELAKRMGVSRNTVVKYREQLEKRGWIKNVGVKRTGNTNQWVTEYALVDLWKENLEYIEKLKVSSVDILKVSTDDKVSTGDIKVSTVGHKEETKDKKNKIYMSFKEKIFLNSRLTKKAKNKIANRLKEYSEKDLLKAIEGFSKNDWWMENNAGRGVAWFFHSEERIDQFLNLKPSKSKLSNSIKPKKGKYEKYK